LKSLYYDARSEKHIKKLSILIIKTNLLMLYEEKIAVCSEIQTKHINAMLTPCRIF